VSADSRGLTILPHQSEHFFDSLRDVHGLGQLLKKQKPEAVSRFRLSIRF